MRSDWPTVEVKEACEMVVDCINNTAPTVDEPTPYKMIRTSNIENGHLDLSDVKYTTKEHYDKWTRRADVKPGDVLLTREAPLGDVALVREEDTIFLGQRIVQFRPDTEILNQQYLSYVMMSPFVQAQIQKFKGSGSVVDHIRVPECEEIEIPLPPLEYQNRVAKILSSIDDKIILNQKMSVTLEDAIRALFKSLFKEFEHSKQLNGTKVGNIPTEWRAGTLGDVMKKITNRVDPDEMPDSTPYLGLKHMPEGSVSLDNWGQAKEVSSTKYKYERGDILFGRLRPYFCKVGIAPTNGVSSTDIQIIAPKDESFWREFILCWLSDSEFIDYCEKVSTGTRMPRVGWKDMCEYNIPIPPTESVLRFSRCARPMIERIVENIHQSNRLRSVRETLLPKLISGELRAAGGFIEEKAAFSEV